jgi:hypothetical protein
MKSSHPTHLWTNAPRAFQAIHSSYRALAIADVLVEMARSAILRSSQVILASASVAPSPARWAPVGRTQPRGS